MEFIVGTSVLTTIARRHQRIVPTERGQTCCWHTRDFKLDRYGTIQAIVSTSELIVSASIRSDHDISVHNDLVLPFHEPIAVTILLQLQYWYCFYCTLFQIISYTMWTTITTKCRHLLVNKLRYQNSCQTEAMQKLSRRSFQNRSRIIVNPSFQWTGTYDRTNRWISNARSAKTCLLILAILCSIQVRTMLPKYILLINQILAVTKKYTALETNMNKGTIGSKTSTQDVKHQIQKTSELQKSPSPQKRAKKSSRFRLLLRTDGARLTVSRDFPKRSQETMFLGNVRLSENQPADSFHLPTCLKIESKLIKQLVN